MKMRHYVSVLVCLFCAYGLLANEPQQMHFSHIGLEDGLSHSTIFAINQDHDGNLWLATYDGLNKYDGYNFTVYRHEYDNSRSIASDISRSITIDDVGRLWVGTREGLSVYHHRQDAFSNYYYQKNDLNVAVTSIVPLQEQLLMLGTAEGILLFDVQQERFLADTLDADLHALRPTALVRENGNVYIGTEEGLYRYTLSNGVLELLVELPRGVKIHTILCQMFNKIWIATEGDGLYLFNLKTRQLQNFRYEDGVSGLNSNYVRSLALDTENRLWIGTYSGLNIYKEGTRRFLSVKSSEYHEGSLSQNSVRSIFRDSQGGMWLGTFWGGVNYYHPLCDRFQCIKHVPSLNSISNNVVSCLVEDNQHDLWIGTSDGGLNFYDNKTRQYKNYLFQTDYQNVPYKDIKTVYVDEAQDKVYVGCHAGGMIVLHRKTGKTTYYHKDNSSLPSNNIYSIISDGYGGLWMASLEHLLHFDAATQNFTVVREAAEVYEEQASIGILFRDAKKRIWVGTDRGIAVYDQEGVSLRRNIDFQLTSALKQAQVNCFYETVSGVMWIGTRNGLFVLDEGTKQFNQYTTANGLPSNVIYGILEDSFGRLWLSTNQGLSCMYIDAIRFRNFTILDGLQGNQFNAGSYCRRDDGTMLFGGVNGITSFRPETLVDNPYTPKPVINKLYVSNQEVLPGDATGILKESISYVDHITLTAAQNSFAVAFVVSNHIAGKHNTFAYMLEGYDNQWRRQNDIDIVSYSYLPAGDYTFYVKAANNDGKWNEEPAELHIHILPVWYRTWWALSLFAAALALLVFFVARFFWLRKNMQAAIRMERLDKEKQEEINQMKIRFFMNMSHELRTPITLIVMPLQELLTRISDHWAQEQLRYVQRNAHRLLHIVNQLLVFRRAELGVFELKAGYGNAYQRVLNCFMNYEDLSKRKAIDYNLYDNLQDKVQWFDGNYLDLILNNLLSNAFKYTEIGESITVRLWQEGKDLVLQVADTGIGIPSDKQQKVFERFYQVGTGKEGNGIGLSLVHRLVELHHGRITLQSEEGKGSVFTVYLPQQEELYTPQEKMGATGEAVYTGVGVPAVSPLYLEEEEVLASDAAEATLDGATVLVVEDNNELRQYLVNGLSAQFTLLEAADGQEALDVLKEKKVDVIVTDVMMPVMDGVQLCKCVKQQFRTCHIPVYMLSAKVDVKDQLEGLQVGADDYIAKPFSMEVLKTKIVNGLHTRERIFEHYSNTPEVEPEKLTNNAMDEELLRKAIMIVEKNMSNVEFSTEQFAREMHMSRSNLHLKLKAITGKSAIDFIHKIRFNRACVLLKEGRYSVAEISFMVGYNTPSYFAARFKKYMGCLPTEYIKK